MGIKKKKNGECLLCGKDTKRHRYIYCSNVCQQQYQHLRTIQNWKAGKISGLQRLGVVSNPIKRFLRDKFDDQCYLCGWAEINKTTGKIPLVADHIDGNWRNNTESNLRLVCPNCDSLSSTYGALNYGHGRPDRPASKRRISVT